MDRYGPYTLTTETIGFIEAIIREVQPLPLTLNDIKHRIPYKKGVYVVGGGNTSVRYTVHHGQYKLFVSELQALGYAREQGINIETMVYAGAAPGTHVLLLSEMFPKTQFVLYDPADFDQRLKHCPNVKCIQELFTDLDVEKWTGKNILFVSDIRSGTVDDDTTFNSFVADDMQRQQEWVLKMRPPLSLMKFRLSYTDGVNDVVTEYLDGTINLQSFCGNTSTEARILIDARNGFATKQYSAIEYEEKHAYFNTVIREWAMFDNPFNDMSLGLCCCFNCSHFSHVVGPIASDVLTRLQTYTRQYLSSPSHGWMIYPWMGPDTQARKKLYEQESINAIERRRETRLKHNRARVMPVSGGVDEYMKKHHGKK